MFGRDANADNMFPALPETTEICRTISTGDRQRSHGRKCRASRDGCSSGRGADSHPRKDGERGDLACAGGGAGWAGERVIWRIYRMSWREACRLRAGYIYPLPRDEGVSSAFGLLHLPFFTSFFPPLRQMSSASSAAFLVWSILAVIVRRRRPQISRQSADFTSALPILSTSAVPHLPHATSLEL